MTPHPEDILIWPDHFYCYRYELEDYPWKSDDYEAFYFDTPDYNAFMEYTENKC